MIFGAGGFTTAIKTAAQQVATATRAVKTAAAAPAPVVDESHAKWWLLGALGLAAVGGGVYYVKTRGRKSRR